MRSTPTPPAPGAVAMAAMVSAGFGESEDIGAILRTWGDKGKTGDRAGGSGPGNNAAANEKGAEKN